MSYAIYIGKNHTADGIAYLAGYGDEPSSHWLEVIPRRSHSEGSTISVGVTEQADMPGIRTNIPQASETARHIRVSYSYYLGVPAPITNGGLNEYGVAVRDIWSPSRPELVEMTPPNQSGPNYSDLARIALERAKTARQAVEIIGSLIDQYGESSYGGNSHFIADSQEAWVLIEFAGNQKLWAAERLDDNAIRASRPGYILDIPIDQTGHPDYLYSECLVSFATEQGWYKSGSNLPFNINDIYGDGKGRWAGVEWVEGEMKNRAVASTKIKLSDIFWSIKTSRLTGDTAGYGQVVPLCNPQYPELRMIWHSPIGASMSPLVPVYLGVDSIPEEYDHHRYLSVDEDAKFAVLHHTFGDKMLTSVNQGVESTRSAVAIFKRLMYLCFQNENTFVPEVEKVFETFEVNMAKKQSDVLETAETLLHFGKKRLAIKYLTDQSTNDLLEALSLCEKLVQFIEIKTRLMFGIDRTGPPRSPKQVW
ncbi:MAG: dipeptidase [Gammaproteobacteria bacterium]|jgi:dipeptidase